MAATERESFIEAQKKGCNYKRLLGRIIVGVAIAVLWVAAILFVLVHYLPEHFGPQINLHAAIDVASSVNSSQLACSPERYTGQICRDALQMYQECLSNGSNSSDLHIPSKIDQKRPEEQIRTLITLLPLLNPTPECMEEILPFLCFYYFGLCGSSGNLQLPSPTRCETLWEDTCASEFAMAVALMGDEQLPQCKALPATTTECTIGISQWPDVQNSSSNISVSCQDYFYPDEEAGILVCKPQCNWKLYSPNLELAITVLQIMFASVGIVAATVVLLISCVHRKRMHKFPSILIVYQTATVLVYEVIMLIGLSFADRLFCTKGDLIASFVNATPYCKFTDMVFPYLYSQLLVWWLSHVAALYWGIRFPFHARSFDSSGKNKYLHLTVLLLGLFLPIIPVIVLGTAMEFEMSRFSPRLCTSVTADASFYTTILPYAVMHVVVSCILVLLFWRVLQERFLKQHGRATVEVKVLINILYFIGTTILVAIAFSVLYQKLSHVTVGQLLTAYFLCESNGVSSDSSCDSSRTELNELIPMQLLFDFCHLLFMLLPVINLTFAINVEQLKKCLHKLNCRLKKNRYNVSSGNTTGVTELLTLSSSSVTL